MNNTILSTALVAALVFGAGTAQAAGFTYHGSLQDSGRPAEGSYDIELTLYSASSGGSVIGGPLTMFNVPVHGGSFNTEADFGPLTKSFSQAYVSVKVRSSGNGEFAALETRAPVSATPMSSVCPGAWTLYGNANGTGSGSFLGTTDASDPLIFKAGNLQVGQIVASTLASPNNDAPNVAFGSSQNSIGAGIIGATIAGGGSAEPGCGPLSNLPCPNSVQMNYATVGGGLFNAANGRASTVAGGEGNTASGLASTVAGGISNTASGIGSSVAGGESNAASGDDSMVAGGFNNTAAGANSFAAGTKANVRAGDGGTFVWADDSVFTGFTSTGSNQFLIRAVGGVGINTNNPNGVSLRVGTGTSNGNGAYVSNGGVWTSASSRMFKDSFARVDPLDVLSKVVAMPVQTWFYKNDHDEGRHMGPVAEDFAQTFALGNDDKHIGTVDESGVAFAAIQGLNQKLDAENAKVKQENADLRSKLDDVLARLIKLESKKGG